MKYPCENCEKNYGDLKKDLRKLFKSCHDHCPFYQNAKHKNEQISKKKYKKGDIDNAVYDCETRVMRKLGIR